MNFNVIPSFLRIDIFMDSVEIENGRDCSAIRVSALH